MDKDTKKIQNTMTGEEIVVSGISGIFPNSDSVQQFMENLYNKVDMVCNETRWTQNDPEVPNYTGKVEGTEKFDAQFFKVGYQQANVMDPLSKKLLEHAYGAIFDSGNTHATLKGKTVGVYIGASNADFSANCMYDINNYTEFMVGGSSKSMFANRISYWVDGKGPSYCLDYSCASSIAALELAYRSIKSGDCDAAVVGGCNLCILPAPSLNSKRAGLLCLDGKTKCFDKKGDGYVRADAINIIFLQKSKDAKRVYAEVYHAQGGYQLKRNERFLPLRKSDDLQNFLNDVYSGTGVDPRNVEYIEANGAALAEADENEVKAIADFFASDKGVKIGCVKSNMGHSESASGLCGLTKLCLAYHKGQIPANLHCQEPVQSATDGRVQVVTEHAKFERGYTALNNLSFTGANFHVVLKGHFMAKTLEQYNSEIPRIVLASGRKESCVSRIIDELKSKQVDAEEIALLHSIFETDIVGHTGRGYTILDTIKGETVAVSESIDYYSGVRPPLWFVYSGMGSQWAGMGTDLMRIPTFAAAIGRCDKVLAPKGIDIVKVITETDNKIFNNILHSFVGIGAVQVGLTEILKEIGIVPDYIIGHSLGETACAYYDETLTVEEMMLCSYSRGRAIQESALVNGSMAAVGIGHKALANQCPPEIDIACHNSSESSTISGPTEVMKEFVDELTKRGIFARMIPSRNVAYHSRYVSDAAPALLRRLKKILKNPKPRSQRWISSSVPREKWDDQEAKYSSAEYHMNNLINPVLFEEMTRLIPKNAVVIEVAPHGLLQAILKRSHKECTHIPLTRRGNTNGVGVKYLLEAIGKLYLAGFNPKVENLYPKVEFPVSTETPLLSHLVEWEHSEDWPEYEHKKISTKTSKSRDIVFSLEEDDYKYLEGHIRNGVNVLPEAGLLAFVWETLAMYDGMDFRNSSVVFKDVQFHSEIVITAGTPVRFAVMISKGNDSFEVTQEDKIVVTGIVSAVNVIEFQHKIDNNYNDTDDEFETDVQLTTQDIYKILRMRGYDYNGKFQAIRSSNLNCNKALVTWTDNWVPFLDSLIQLNIVSRGFNGISKPKFIRRLKFSASEQKKVKYETVDGVHCYDARIIDIYGVTRCAGVEIEDIRYTDVPLKEDTVNALETRSFFAYFPTEEVNIKTALEMNLQIISENSITENIVITKVVTETVPKEFDFIDEVVDKVFWVNSKIRTLKDSGDEVILTATKNNEIDQTNVIVLENLLQSPKDMKSLQNVLSKDTFILSLEDKFPKLQSPLRDCFNILSCISDGTKIWILMRRLNRKSTSHISISFDDTFSWVPDVLSKLVTTKRMVLVSERQPYCGVLGLVTKLKADGHNNISVVIIDDFHAPKFDPDNDFYKEQLQKNMTVNILRKGQWGSFFFKSSKTTKEQKSFALKNQVPGHVEKLSWVEAPRIPGDRTLVQVCYSGLSIKDYHDVLHNDENEVSSFGMEFSGIDRNGDRVMGLIDRGSVASTIEVDPNLLWPVPDHWTLEDAATVPLAYVQAYYSLTIRSTLVEGISILILDATCSVGLALIAICISFNCTIYTVVDSEDKKKKLLQLYPQLEENNIIFSNNESFYNDVKKKRNGCDFVVNFASGPIREAAMKSGNGYSATFLDFSKHDIYENKAIGMFALFQCGSYITVDVKNIFKPEYATDRKILQTHITQGIKSGVVKPLCRVVFSPLQLDRAFKALSLNSNTGKVLIRIRDPSIMSTGLKAIPRLSYSIQDVLIIVCDEKGIGIELADKLIERGARKILLHMKTSSISGYLHTKFLTWAKQEVSVKLSSDNLQTENGSRSLMKNAMKLGKVKGIFIVFDPKQTDNGMKEDFINAFMKQSLVLVNLDMASRNSSDLCHFVILSRFTQSPSDEYALSLTERVCDTRNEMGLPTLILRYDSLVELDDNKSETKKTQPQTVSALFNAIETSLKLKYKNVLTFNLRKEEKAIVKETPEYEDGMYTFYKHVFTAETEEQNIISPVVEELPTLINNGINTNLDPNDSFIILVPGFEGRCQVFESATEMLKMRAISIELGPDVEGESIQDIAYYARKELKRRFGNINNMKFHIMGYSFGVNIAMELAAILEKEGNSGIIYCIDGSPDAMRTILETVLGEVSNENLQIQVLNHIFNLITGKKDSSLKADLKKIATFEEKVEECLKRMKGVVKYSKQFMKLTLESAYKRIIMAREYMPDIKLKSAMVLMKSSIHLSADLADDYGLSKYSEEPVKVFRLEADHATAPHDIRVSNIVNLSFDTNHLNKFKKQNLCNMYLYDCNNSRF